MAQEKAEVVMLKEQRSQFKWKPHSEYPRYTH